MRRALPMWPATTSPVAMPIASRNGFPSAWMPAAARCSSACNGQGPRGVVFAHARRPEHGHQPVAVELVEQSVVLEHDLNRGSEELVEDVDDGFRIEAVRRVR